MFVIVVIISIMDREEVPQFVALLCIVAEGRRGGPWTRLVAASVVEVNVTSGVVEVK